MALKVNNQPNTQNIGVNHLYSTPLYVGGDSPQPPAGAPLQPAQQVGQFASGNMNKPNNPPRYTMLPGGLARAPAGYGAPNYNLLSGSWWGTPTLWPMLHRFTPLQPQQKLPFLPAGGQ